MPKSQCFIASFHRDFIWLKYALLSLRKFGRGWLPPVVCVEQKDLTGCMAIVDWAYPGAGILVKNCRNLLQPFMRAQVAMMEADLYCRDADNIFFLGSDCIAYKEFTPEPYLDAHGRPAVLYSSYEVMTIVHSDTIPWRKGVTRVLGFEPPAEYMRRLPSVFPRSIFKPMREHVENLHGLPFEQYIYEADAAHRDTSEANILGAFAARHMPETCHWVDIAAAGMYGSEVNGWPSAICQMWSHGGLDRPMDQNVILPDGTPTVGRTPRSVCDQILFGIDNRLAS